MENKNLNLKEIVDSVLKNANNRIESEDFYHRAKRGENVPAPVHPETVEKLLAFYSGVDHRTLVSMYLDACDTLGTATGKDFESTNTPHIVLYNKTIAMSIIINKYNKK